MTAPTADDWQRVVELLAAAPRVALACHVGPDGDALGSMLALGACSSVRQGIGLSKITPDEFLTVSTAPLTVPPEYGLRPPAPGQPRPQELAPESAARQILLGQRQSITRTAGEQALVTAAGADRADPLARYVVDDEFGDLAHKEESFANRVLFWRRDDAATQAPLDALPPVDPFHAVPLR